MLKFIYYFKFKVESDMSLKKNTKSFLIILCSAVYFVSYFSRKDFAAVMEGMISENIIEKSLAGLALTMLFIFYGVGQLISGYLGDKFRANDDGEPSGSSGRPVLGQIDSLGLSDVLVVVVRYFGGIKLGIPGLIRAYKSSTADALANAEIIEKIASKMYRVHFGYMSMNSVMKVMKDMNLEQKNQKFDMECSIDTSVRLSLVDTFLERMGDVEGCRVDEL